MKKEFIQIYDLVHQDFNIENPLTIGNGNFAFTCDITGLQTFYEAYSTIPLCTMTNLVWGKQKGKGDLPLKGYLKASSNTIVYYMTDTKAATYENYRDDWFKFDLFKLAFFYKNKKLDKTKITKISQHLSLYDGYITSEFLYEGELVYVKTKIPQKHNTLHLSIKTKLKGLQVRLYFLVPSSNMQGALPKEEEQYSIKEDRIIRKTGCVEYELYYKTNMAQENLSFACLEESNLSISLDNDFKDDFAMNEYFDQAKSIDTKDEELNRRMVLSLYLLKVNTLGIYPPAETGLTCNSWYGKFHLEMHLWHHLGIVRFGLYEYVLPSIRWYLTLLESAKKRAEEQGYSGIRFPKMTDPRGVDTPSNIGCLLIWQMPHLFILLDEIRKLDAKAINLKEYFPLLLGLIEFMSSFFYWKEGAYHLDSPLIPANENVEYDCDTPIFEECYILHTFTIFLDWVEEYSLSYDTSRLQDILKQYVPLEIQDGCYEAFVGCRTTYTEYNHDHPMMVGMYSYFESSIVNPEIIKNTLDKILSCWCMEDTWGWDFPMLSMVANRLKDKALAIKILKMKAWKNGYIYNGHNPQLPKKNLPVYLPGNGAFLLAITHLFEVNYES